MGVAAHAFSAIDPEGFNPGSHFLEAFNSQAVPAINREFALQAMKFLGVKATPTLPENTIPELIYTFNWEVGDINDVSVTSHQALIHTLREAPTVIRNFLLNLPELDTKKTYELEVGVSEFDFEGKILLGQLALKAAVVE